MCPLILLSMHRFYGNWLFSFSFCLHSRQHCLSENRSLLFLHTMNFSWSHLSPYSKLFITESCLLISLLLVTPRGAPSVFDQPAIRVFNISCRIEWQLFDLRCLLCIGQMLQCQQKKKKKIENLPWDVASVRFDNVEDWLSYNTM